MTKGNPLWDTSYNSIVTIQEGKKNKKPHMLGPPHLANMLTELNLNGASFYTSCSKVIFQVAVIIKTEPQCPPKCL